MNKLETAQQLLVDLRLIMATAKTLMVDVEKVIQDDTANSVDLHTFMVLGAVLRCNEAKSPKKLACYKRNIIAAENAMKLASTDQDGTAYLHALSVLKWATAGRDREMA